MQTKIKSLKNPNITLHKIIERYSIIVIALLFIVMLGDIIIMQNYNITKKTFYWMKVVNISILLNTVGIYFFLIKHNFLNNIMLLGINISLLFGEEIVEIMKVDKIFILNNGIEYYNKFYLLSRMFILSYLFIAYLFKVYIKQYKYKKKVKIILVHFILQIIIGIFVLEKLIGNINEVYIEIFFCTACIYFISKIYTNNIKNKKERNSIEIINVYSMMIIGLNIIVCFILKDKENIITLVCLSCSLFYYILYFIWCVTNLQVMKDSFNEFMDKSIKDLQEVKLYKSIVDLVPRGIVISNIYGEILYFNEFILDILQCKKEYIENKNLFNIFTDKTNDLMQIEKIKNTLENNSMWDGELCINNKVDKKIIKCEIIKLIEFNGSKAIVTIIDDITSNKKMSDKILNNEKKLRRITDSMLDFITNIDRNGNIRYISTSFCEKFGMSYKKIRGTKIYEYICSEELQSVEKFIERKLNHDNFENKIEYRLKVGKSRYIWVESVMNSIKDEYGEIQGIVITSRDINRRKYFENELIKSERKYKDFFNMVNNYIYVVDLNTLEIIDINDYMKNEFKIIKKMELKELFEEIPFKIHMENFKKVCADKLGCEFECSTSKLTGEEVDLEVSLSPLYEDNKVAQIICSAKDISHRKKMQRLEERHVEDKRKLDHALECDRLKTEFLANISHELRTPINVIFTAIQMEEKINKRADKEDKYIKLMKQNSYRLLRLINNLIDVTKIEAGYLPVNFAIADIIRVVEDITMSIVDYARNKDITVIFDTEIEELFIRIDLDKIERIIMNLLSNAIKFTPNEGFIYVYMKKNNNNIVISVKDTGRGIPKDKINSIFDRFTQVDKSLTRDHEGSGIGLYLVKLLVNMHDGTIEVKSELGKGSEFIVKIPIESSMESNKINLRESDCYVQKISIEFSDIYDIN